MYASVKYPKPVELKKLQGVLKPKEVILEYFLTEKEGVYCFVIAKNSYNIVKLNATAQEVNDKVESIRKRLQDIEEENPTYRRALLWLHERLLNPLSESIKDKELIIIPDGILATIPFEILKDKDDKRMIERYTIKYMQSATLVYLYRTEYKGESAKDGFVGFGDPVYDTERPSEQKGTTLANLTRSRYERLGGSMNRLPASGIEVEQIANKFKEKQRTAKKYLRQEATEENAKRDDMSEYGYVHFSAHGILDDKMQAIALSQSTDAKEDGFLTIGEIMNSKYNARLAVLSACQTGLGKAKRGEGVIGLTRAVMYAGAPAVVASLWNVSDEVTKDFMIVFYDKLINKGMSKTEALKQTKLEMMKEGSKYRNAFYWSAFVMYGE
jgi:CHAT domain-containing protein